MFGSAKNFHSLCLLILAGVEQAGWAIQMLDMVEDFGVHLQLDNTTILKRTRKEKSKFDQLNTSSRLELFFRKDVLRCFDRRTYAIDISLIKPGNIPPPLYISKSINSACALAVSILLPYTSA